MSPYASYFLESLLLLVGVCVLAVAVLAFGRKLGLGKPHGPLALRGHLPLDARRAVYLIQAGKQLLVVGASESGLTKLGELTDPELVTEPVTKERSFADWLKKDDPAAEAGAKL
jgi:flagellar biogenesis protein FliO